MQLIDTPEGLRVYADWLLSQGNLHGELITLQLARQTAGRAPAAQRALRLREEELLGKHGAELAGPLARESRLAWRHGFVREAYLRVEEGAPSVADVLARGPFALVERLSVQGPVPLETFAHLPNLRVLELERFDEGVLELTHVPRGLQRLRVSARSMNVHVGAMPELDTLELIDGGFAPVSPQNLPKLRRARASTLVPFAKFRGLELHLQGEDPGVDLHELAATRVVATVEYDGEFPPGDCAVRTSEQASERAFVFFEGSADDVRRALDRLRQVPLDGAVSSAHRAWKIGPHSVAAIELRSPEPQPTLLRMLAADLAAKLPRGVVEAAISGSNGTSQFRGHERLGANVTTWMLANNSHASALDGFRRGVDRLLGFDPGIDALEDVYFELDGALPQSVRGELPKEQPQPPCCSPLEAHVAALEDDEENDDDYEDEDEYWTQEEEAHLESAAQPVDVKVDLALMDAETEEDEEDDPDEPHHDAADADIEALLTQSPIDSEDPEEGLEPATETGLDTEPSVDSLVAAPKCETCRRDAVADTCYLCATDVCEACIAVESPVTCKECRGIVTQPSRPAVPRPSAPSARPKVTMLAPLASAKPLRSPRRTS